MTRADAFAPAKINLTLHVTGRRADGYHLLDSLVMFADVVDHVSVSKAADTALRVTGPMAAGVPGDARNLCWQAARAFGEPVSITLEKHLPAAAGIGGGSSDAAAVLRAMEALFDRPMGFDPAELGADLPVCLTARSSRMTGIGERVTPIAMPPLHAVLINPGVAVSTKAVFGALGCADNTPMGELPAFSGAETALGFIAAQRNDLEPAAKNAQPVIEDCLNALSGTTLARMSGSGATCFGLVPTREEADALAARLGADRPDWWVRSATLT